MIYRAEYENESFEIFEAENDDEALEQAWSYESENGSLFNLFEVTNDTYEEIRTIL